MEKLDKTIIDVINQRYTSSDNRPLDSEQQYRLIEICKKLDQAQVLHNDGNPLNFMVNSEGVIFVIDFGFSKLITKALIKKRGPNPNIGLTLWHLERNLKHYNIQAELLKECYEEYKRSRGIVSYSPGSST